MTLNNPPSPQKNCFRCLLRSKTCVARDSSSFAAHKIHVGVWTDISTRYFPDDPICLFSMNTHINKPFWRERPISWVYISAGNHPLTSYIYGLNQLWLTEFTLAFLNPQMQLSQRHYFWIVALSAWNVSMVLGDLSVALTIHRYPCDNKQLSLLCTFPSDQYWGRMLGGLRGEDMTMSSVTFLLKDLQRTKHRLGFCWKFKQIQKDLK